MSWYVADTASGHPYSNPAIPVWNALIRLGFFVINGMLLTALRNSLLGHQILARTDALTGLYSRRAFDDRLKHDLALAQRRKSLLTIAYVDVDDFKIVNDTHGHAGGDRVLQLIAKVLNGAARASDTAARVGGDEFALLLPDTDNRGAQLFISKLTRALQDTLEANNWTVTVSIGVVTVLDSATSPERAVAAADGLMFKVKASGKSAVAFSLLGEVVEPSVAERGC